MASMIIYDYMTHFPTSPSSQRPDGFPSCIVSGKVLTICSSWHFRDSASHTTTTRSSLRHHISLVGALTHELASCESWRTACTSERIYILSLSSEHLASCCVLGAFQMFFCNVLVSITWLVGMWFQEGHNWQNSAFIHGPGITHD